jgi:small subunit ribosomal protein S1
MSNNNESFAELFEQSQQSTVVRPGSTVPATILKITSDYIIVNTGLKSDAKVFAEEFRGEDIEIGQQTKVVVEALEDGFGNTRVSREKARRTEAWDLLETAFESGKNVLGVVSERVKGGFTVDVNAVRAFLPGSLIDVRSTREAIALEGKTLELKIIKMDQKRNNIVVSRKAVIEEESGGDREALLGTLEEGQEFMGVVKNITDYGAFIDLGGIDGLLHITDMAWKRVKHPSEVLKIGDEIKVKVLKYDREKQRVSLGLKQLGEDPWLDIARRYPPNTRLFGHITNITDYGCFVQIEDGIEGLVHMSEMDWTNKNVHPAKLVHPGQETEVVVLEIDEERRRISLGMKQCMQNPWDQFSESHEKGQKISGKIKSITDFGIFIGLPGNIDGLIHLSDISWQQEPTEALLRNYKKGDEVEALILSIDPDRERISLGIKQLEADPNASFTEKFPKGTLVTGEVVSVDKKSVTLKLDDDVQGQIRASDISNISSDNPEDHFSVGDSITAKVVGFDRKTNICNLSIKALDEQQPSTTKAATDKKSSRPSKETISNTTLGDLLREKMKNQEQK